MGHVLKDSTFTHQGNDVANNVDMLECPPNSGGSAFEIQSDNCFVYKTTSSPLEIIQLLEHDRAEDITIFLVANSGVIPSVHPRRLKEEIKKIIPGHANIETLRLTRQGKLLFVTKSAETAQQIISIQALGNIPVTPVLQPECITTRFLLHDIPEDVSCKEIAEDLYEAGISCWEVRRFIKYTNGQTIPTKTVLVTKLGTSLPSEIKLWYQRHKISLFIDRPRCCQNCWAYNHGTRNCKKEKVCRQCGSSHEGACKEGAKSCASCSGAHGTGDKACPRYIEEMKIQEFKSTHHLTITEARRKYKNKDERTNYATIAAKQTKDSYRSSNTEASKYLESTLTKMIDVLVSLKDSIEKAREDQEENCKKIITTIQNMVQCVQQPHTPKGYEDKPPTEQSNSPARKIKKTENITATQPSLQTMTDQNCGPNGLTSHLAKCPINPDISKDSTQTSYIPPPVGKT